MAKTRSKLEEKIADDLARGDLTAQISDAVDIAISAYEDDRFSFNEAYGVTVTLSSSATFLNLTDLPVHFLDIDRIRVLRAANDYIDMYRRDYDWIMARQDAVAYTLPIEWCVYADKIQFDSGADQAYTLVIDGVKRLQSSNSYSGSSTVAWFNDARELIRHRARREIYMHVLKDGEMATSAKLAEDDAFDILKAKINKRASTGFIRPTEF